MAYVATVTSTEPDGNDYHCIESSIKVKHIFLVTTHTRLVKPGVNVDTINITTNTIHQPIHPVHIRRFPKLRDYGADKDE